MRSQTTAKAQAKRPETDFFLMTVIWGFGLSPIVLGVSLAIAQTFHLFH